VLITGSAGFIGARVVKTVLDYGFKNVTCMVRPASNRSRLESVIRQHPEANVRIVEGNLLSPAACRAATQDATVVLHLAAGTGKTFAGCVLSSVVTTKNLLEAIQEPQKVKRFVNVSSFSVYSNFDLSRNAMLDETCALETKHVDRNEPYAYAKLKQDELVQEYSSRLNIPYVIVRPGAVYGPGKADVTGRVGIDTFGFFLHLGGRNRIPFTYVDNCADAIVLAGIVKGVDGLAFNVVDDDLPTSKNFFAAYRSRVWARRYVAVPYRAFYVLCWLWERYAQRSNGQIPAVFNRRRCSAYWKGNRYSNQRLKDLLGWTPAVPFREGSQLYFEYLKGIRTC